VIPQIIHQIWNDVEIPEAWKDFVLSWRRYHPQFRFYLWTASDIPRFLAERCPDLLPLHDRLSSPVERADLFRLVALRELGGIYVDLDMECLAPIESLLSGSNLFVAREPDAHCDWWSRDIYGTAVIGAEPQHPFFADMLAAIETNNVQPDCILDVLTSTGPFLFTDLYQPHIGRGATVLPAQTFYPFGYGRPELLSLLGGEPAAQEVHREVCASGSFGIHYWWGSWLDKFLSSELVNPKPNAVPGFLFRQGVDSPGGFFSCGRRDVSILAALALEEPKIVGFSTSGILKGQLTPPKDWVALEGAGANEGLYIKIELAGQLSDQGGVLAKVE